MTGKQPRLRDFQLLAPRSVLVALRFCCSLRHGEAIKSADQHRLVPGLLSYSCHDSQQLATETCVVHSRGMPLLREVSNAVSKFQCWQTRFDRHDSRLNGRFSVA